MSDEVDDPWRWCKWCKTDCYADQPNHAPSCPSVTGLYSYVASEYPHGLVCPGCAHVYEEGEVFTQKPLTPATDNDEHWRIYVSGYCLGCAALDPEFYA